MELPLLRLQRLPDGPAPCGIAPKKARYCPGGPEMGAEKARVERQHTAGLDIKMTTLRKAIVLSRIRIGD